MSAARVCPDCGIVWAPSNVAPVKRPQQGRCPDCKVEHERRKAKRVQA